MERLGCAASDAARQLAKISEDSGVSLIQLASDIVGEPVTVSRLSEQSSEPVAQPILAPPSVAVAEAAMELAEDGTALATAMLAQTLASAGATAVAIWLIAPDGAVELAGQDGFGPTEASRWQRIPPGTDAPAARAASDGAEFWWAKGRPAGDETALIGSWDGGARAVVPVVTENGRCIGALEVSWPRPDPRVRRSAAPAASMRWPGWPRTRSAPGPPAPNSPSTTARPGCSACSTGWPSRHCSGRRSGTLPAR